MQFQPWKGTVNISPRNVEGKKLSIAYVPQQIASFNDGFPSSVSELVQSGRFNRTKSWFAKEHSVSTIFFETLVDPNVAQVVADEIGAKTDVLNPLEGLTEDDLKNNRDYIAVMQQNLEALKKALNE